MNDSNQLGGCQCGQVRYQLDTKQHQLNVCHCRDCQQQSGSAFGMSLVVPATAFKLNRGELKKFTTTTASGRTKTCAFCASCGVRIYNTTSAFLSVKPGTLDDPSWLQPDAHYWTAHKQDWTELPTNTPCFATSK